MSETLSEKDADQLFKQISKAMKDGDDMKLGELMTAPKEEVVEEVKEPDLVVEETKEPLVEEVKKLDEKKDEVKEEKKEEVPPVQETKAEPAAKKEPAAEPSEMDKLKEQLERMAKENHALRSQAGRVPSVQRKIRELDTKLEELAKKQASPSSQPSAKIQPRVQELLKGVEDSDPELAKAIALAITEATKGVASDVDTKERETLTFLREQEIKTYQDHEAQRLLEMVPNAIEVFKSPTWAEWKNEQSSGVIGLASSDNADDVALAFQLYTKDMYAKYPELAPKDTGAAVAAPAVEDEATKRARQVEAERARKKEASVNIGSPNLPGKVNLPDDPQALFNKFSEEIRKQISGK